MDKTLLYILVPSRFLLAKKSGEGECPPCPPGSFAYGIARLFTIPLTTIALVSLENGVCVVHLYSTGFVLTPTFPCRTLSFHLYSKRRSNVLYAYDVDLDTRNIGVSITTSNTLVNAGSTPLP